MRSSQREGLLLCIVQNLILELIQHKALGRYRGLQFVAFYLDVRTLRNDLLFVLDGVEGLHLGGVQLDDFTGSYLLQASEGDGDLLGAI